MKTVDLNLEDQVHGGIGSQTDNIVWFQVYNQVRHQVYEQVGTQLREQVWNQTRKVANEIHYAPV